MKILLVADYEADQQQSMARFARMLRDGLAAVGHEVRTIRPSVILARRVSEHSSLRKWLAYLDKLVLFPPVLRRSAEWADVVHICDHSNALYSSAVRGKPFLVTCHDLLAIRSAVGDFSENRTRWSGRIYQKMIRRGLECMPLIVCVSESTRNDLIRIIDRNDEDIRVVPNGLNYPYAPMPAPEAERHLERLGILRRPRYLLHVGGNHWYKNRMGVLRIFDKVARQPGVEDLMMVLAGEPCSLEMTVFVSERNLRHRVVTLEGPSDEQMRALYSMASGLLFPSLYEGFGWPIIEAHACGCPVFTTNRPPMTEVGGASAIYIDPGKIEQAAGVIVRALRSGEGGGAEALANAARFKPSVMIESYLAAYRSALGRCSLQTRQSTQGDAM